MRWMDKIYTQDLEQEGQKGSSKKETFETLQGR